MIAFFGNFVPPMCVANDGCSCFPMVPTHSNPNTVVRKVCCSTPIVAAPTLPMIVFFWKLGPPMCVANDGLFWFPNGDPPTHTPRYSSETCVAQPQSSPPQAPINFICSETWFAMCVANDGFLAFQWCPAHPHTPKQGNERNDSPKQRNERNDIPKAKKLCLSCESGKAQ